MLKKPALPFLTAILFVFSSSLIGFGQEEKFEKDLQGLLEKYEAVGLAVATVKDGKLIYSHSLGEKDISTHTLLSPDHLFRIASISKSFTATAIMQMVEAGKVTLEDDVSDLMGFKVRNPRFPETPITLKMLLSHTSSLNDAEGYFTLDVIDPYINPEWQKCYNEYEPGKGYQYCNLNFNMTGAILEKLSGVRFDQYVQQNILKPLHLYGGYQVDSLDATRFATLYTYDAESKAFNASPMAYASKEKEFRHYIMGWTTPLFSPTGGMKISVPDLAKYMIMHMNYGWFDGGRIMSKRSAKRLQRVVAKKQGYGLALLKTDKLIQGETMVGHTGSAYGLYSAMFFHPKKKFGFVVITNGCKATNAGGFNELLSETINTLHQHFIANP